MLLKREDIEAREKKNLAPYAVSSASSRGREYNEPEDPYRTVFQRDRDRVIHSKAFRRLKGKTQVFVAHYGDHYRSRLSHTMEVAQLSRDIARMLNLNEDLAETIALAHDLGHTPFGHAGQDVMNEMMRKYDRSFEHNEQSLRIVEFLEKKSPNYRGLNLTFEVRDGLIKHRTPYDHPTSDDNTMPSIEAQIVNIADEIAYLNHDIDDGLRAGILTIEGLRGLSLWQRAEEKVESNIIPSLISRMVNDLAENTNRLIGESGIESVEDVYKSKLELGKFSYNFRKECNALKNFLYKNFYLSDEVSKVNKEKQDVIRFLFDKLIKDLNLLPEEIRLNQYDDEECVLVKDYIAGMTDQYALDLYDKLK